MQHATESDTPVYGEYAVPEVLFQVYEALVINNGQNVDMGTVKEKLGVLLQTLEVNPAVFFSNSFKLGVYLPILAPIVFPIGLIAWAIIIGKLKKLKAPATQVKEKDE